MLVALLNHQQITNQTQKIETRINFVHFGANEPNYNQEKQLLVELVTLGNISVLYQGNCKNI